jgi:tetratricopeptide (TPR) repeat protein
MSSGWLAVLLLMLAAAHGTPIATADAQQSEGASTGVGQMPVNPDSPKWAALEAQRKAETDPSEANLFLYASSLMKVNYPAAETIYRYAVNKYPNSVRLHAGLASALWAQLKRDEGAAEFCRAAKLAPDDPHPLEFLVSTGHIPASMYQEVVDGLHQLHLRYPRDGLILFDYEMVVSDRFSNTAKPPKDFVPTLKEAIRLTPQLPEAYFQLSLVYDEQKEYSEEVAALRRAVELSPQDEQYAYNLAMAYKRLGNKDAFLKELSIFEKLHQESMKSLK